MIELKNVYKNYGMTRALVDVGFSIEKGEIIGFVGPNGAGKSTAMKIITTYTAPTSGTVSVGGYDVLDSPLEVRQMIGYLPETVPLYYDMLVHEYLTFMGEARHLNGRLAQRAAHLVARSRADATGARGVCVSGDRIARVERTGRHHHCQQRQGYQHYPVSRSHVLVPPSNCCVATFTPHTPWLMC